MKRRIEGCQHLGVSPTPPKKNKQTTKPNKQNNLRGLKGTHTPSHHPSVSADRRGATSPPDRCTAPLSPSAPVTLPAECESARAAGGRRGTVGSVGERGREGGGGGRVCLERRTSPGVLFNTGESDTVTNATRRELFVRLLTVFNGSHVHNKRAHTQTQRTHLKQ